MRRSLIVLTLPLALATTNGGLAWAGPESASTEPTANSNTAIYDPDRKTKTSVPALLVAIVSIAILCFGVTSAAIAGATEVQGKDFTEWAFGSGSWTNRARWSEGLPNPFQRTEIHGNSAVIIPPGNYVAGDLEIGLKSGDDALVTVDGGKMLLLQDSLRVGELTGSKGEFILKQGALHCPMDVYCGAANSVPGRATKAAIRIEGGSFLARTLIVGSGWGADSLLAIEGSRPSAIHVLDYCYIQAFAGTNGTPGVGTLSFTLDEHGVTPITIQSHRDGLRIIKDTKSHCRLEIRLSAVPPREDITLGFWPRADQGNIRQFAGGQRNLDPISGANLSLGI